MHETVCSSVWEDSLQQQQQPAQGRAGKIGGSGRERTLPLAVGGVAAPAQPPRRQALGALKQSHGRLFWRLQVRLPLAVSWVAPASPRVLGAALAACLTACTASRSSQDVLRRVSSAAEPPSKEGLCTAAG